MTDDASKARDRLSGSTSYRWRAGVLFIVVLAIIVIAQFTPVREKLADLETWQDRLESGGAAARVLFVVATALLTCLGIPRLLFFFLGGLMFGIGEGFPLSMVGALIGAWGLFTIARWGGQEWVHLRVADSPRLNRIAQGSLTIWTVFLMRQTPLPGFVVNVFLGMTTARHRTFLVGSIIGFVPAGLVAVLCGAGLISGTLYEAVPVYASALGLFILLVWLVPWLLSRRTGQTA